MPLTLYMSNSAAYRLVRSLTELHFYLVQARVLRTSSNTLRMPSANALCTADGDSSKNVMRCSKVGFLADDLVDDAAERAVLVVGLDEAS